MTIRPSIQNNRRQFPGHVVGLLIVACAVFLSGCGSEQEDAYARAARRVRDKQDTVKPATPPAQPKVASVAEVAAPEVGSVPAVQGIASTSVAADSRPPETPTVVEPSEDDIDFAKITIEPIDQRSAAIKGDPRPAPIRVQSKLQTIGRALANYQAQRRRLPFTAIKSKQGVPTLSWRVAILPYMGFGHLFEQFDPDYAWDHPRNKPLLKHIPDVYVSVERADTKTNFLGLSGANQVFAGEGGVLDEDSDDGFENTLAVIEVDDAYAVPWTQPSDYPFEKDQIRTGAGNLRGEGFFGVWADGKPTFLSQTVSDEIIAKLVNVRSYDGVRGILHQSPVSAALAGVAANTQAENNFAATGSVDTNPAPALQFSGNANASPGRSAALEIPSRSDLLAASKTLDSLYGDRIEDAVTDPQLSEIASELFSQAKQLRDDPVGRYVTYRKAFSMANQSSDVSLSLKCMDEVKHDFAIDEYEWLATMFDKLDASSFGLRNNKSDLDALVKRMIDGVHHAIRNDRYADAISLTRTVIRLYPVSKSTDSEQKVSIGRLGSRLSAAQKKYTEIEPSFAKLVAGDVDKTSAMNIGMFYCFYKGDWENGLAFLADCGHPTLEPIAKKDRQGGTSTKSLAEIGDAWWQLSTKAKPGIYRDSARSRASTWYQKAIDASGESLAKVYLEKKVAEIDDQESTDLMTMLYRLADDYAVKLAGRNDVRGRARIAMNDED